MSLPVYESGNVKVTWNGENLSEGWAADAFLEIEPLSARNEMEFGCDGQMAPSKMANRGATIKMTFQQTAPINKKLAKIASLQDKLGGKIPFSPFTVEDTTGDSAHFVALEAMLTELAGHSFGAKAGTKTWVWVCESYFETDNPLDVFAALTDFLGF